MAIRLDPTLVRAFGTGMVLAGTFVATWTLFWPYKVYRHQSCATHRT